MSVRVRFAPSPTGFLHIGGVRTAFFNWLFARRHQGTFILRIEDTDAQRNTKEAVDLIMDGLEWLGIDWDEGPVRVGDGTIESKGERGPYQQSLRRRIYDEKVRLLMDRGAAYERDGAILFRRQREAVTIHDLLVGDVRRELTDREARDPDFVIVRADGQPVFHLVNVVDDIEMGVTHVIRGEDHLVNTTKHLALFEAFGVAPPRFAHIPLILNEDGSKMSKRDRGASLADYRTAGYLPEAVLNYLFALGNPSKDGREVFGLAEMRDRFDLNGLSRKNACFDLQKLRWLNAEHLRGATRERFLELARAALENANVPAGDFDPDYVEGCVESARDKSRDLAELVEMTSFYFAEKVAFEPSGAKQHLTAENRPRLEKVANAFASLDEFADETVGQAVKDSAKSLGVKPGALFGAVRFACSGRTSGPDFPKMLAALGKERVVSRLRAAVSAIES